MTYLLIPKHLVYKQADHHTVGAAREYNAMGAIDLVSTVDAVLCNDPSLGLKVLQRDIMQRLPLFNGGVTANDWELAYVWNEIEEDPESGVQRVNVSTEVVRTVCLAS